MNTGGMKFILSPIAISISGYPEDMSEVFDIVDRNKCVLDSAYQTVQGVLVFKQTLTVGDESIRTRGHLIMS